MREGIYDKDGELIAAYCADKPMSERARAALEEVVGLVRQRMEAEAAEGGWEPLSRRSEPAEVLLWAADELDAQADARGQAGLLRDYTDHLRCFATQPARPSMVPRSRGPAPAASPDTQEATPDA